MPFSRLTRLAKGEMTWLQRPAASPSGLLVALTLVAVCATGCFGAAGARVRGTKRCGAIAAGRGRRRSWRRGSHAVRRQGYIEGIAFSECLGCLGLEGATTAVRVACPGRADPDRVVNRP